MMTLSDLLEVVYRFYPRDLLEGPGAYFHSEELYRQKEATRRPQAGDVRRPAR
jgi:hypothetical protein